MINKAPQVSASYRQALLLLVFTRNSAVEVHLAVRPIVLQKFQSFRVELTVNSQCRMHIDISTMGS